MLLTNNLASLQIVVFIGKYRTLLSQCGSIPSNYLNAGRLVASKILEKLNISRQSGWRICSDRDRSWFRCKKFVNNCHLRLVEISLDNEYPKSDKCKDMGRSFGQLCKSCCFTSKSNSKRQKPWSPNFRNLNKK